MNSAYAGPVDNPVVLYSRRLLSDQLTPVMAYRRLVAPDERTAASFLFESVEQGGAVGRYSMLGAQPAVEVVARQTSVSILTRLPDGRTEERTMETADPLEVPASLNLWSGVRIEGDLPEAFHGGWVGYLGFDAVRWFESSKLPFSEAPHDDRGLPDMHMALYRDVVVFDHAAKTIYLVCAVFPWDHGHSASADAGNARLNALESRVTTANAPLKTGRIDIALSAKPRNPGVSSMSRAKFENAVVRTKQYIAAGDAFQVVLSQRFDRKSRVDPFDVYRALRIVNPSPYQVYLQARGCILVAASPEILCRTRGDKVVNRPLAGTRPRGVDAQSDLAMERELLADEKERAEHTMLVDLGRNDLARVCEHGSVHVERCMEIERFSHVMHISSTLCGSLRTGMDSWDALRATLPVGTVSGAPKVRAIQIIDELESHRRGPYAGGFGAIGWNGDMDMAIALRTIVVPESSELGSASPREWNYQIQAGAGVVLDSDPSREYDETVNKAAGLARAIDLAESSLGACSSD